MFRTEVDGEDGHGWLMSGLYVWSLELGLCIDVASFFFF